ncbi:endonuclease domain-containing protein [Streptomyces sp. NPDC001889]
MTTTPKNEPTASAGLPRRQHADQYSGTRYRSSRRPPATEYQCDLCPDAAEFWDHCHDHGTVRGPLCRSCNGSEYLWPHTHHGVRHLMRCPGCRTAGHPPLRARIQRAAMTVGLVLGHVHTGPSGSGWPGEWDGGREQWRERWEEVFRQLSAGGIDATAVCGQAECGARWRVTLSRDDFHLLDRVRMLTQPLLPGQGGRSPERQFQAENTPVFWHATPPEGPVFADTDRPGPVTVLVPGAYGRRLEAALGDLLGEIATEVRWVDRGRSASLEITAHTIGLIALNALLHLPRHRMDPGSWTRAEDHGQVRTGERVREALAALQGGLG